MRNRRKLLSIRLWALGLTALVVLSISAGAMSFALFTDDATVDANSFTAGTIVLATSPASTLFSVSGMLPGDTSYGQLTVSNGGTGELRYAMTTSTTDPDSKALADALTLEIREKAAGSCSADFTGTVVLSSTVLSGAAFGDVTAGQDAGDRVLASSASEDLCFKVSLPDVGNAYQAATTTATFTFSAEQTANNT